MSRLIGPDEIARALIGLLAAPLAFAEQKGLVLDLLRTLKAPFKTSLRPLLIASALGA